ncbi:unnamed protein product [Amoebophrya sp. A25]|nr:unnamed protein product [Amoebophrya sp. A25]|eukprot:GSA25T00016572001.1
MDWQARELVDLTRRSLDSGTIEWAVNIEICDMVLANPDLSIEIVPIIAEAMSTSSSSTNAQYGSRAPAWSVSSGSSGSTGATTGGRSTTVRSPSLPSQTSLFANSRPGSRGTPTPAAMLQQKSSAFVTHVMNVGKMSQVCRSGLAISLLEMLIKNCGMAFVRYIDRRFCDVWERLIRRKQSLGYKLARNVFGMMLGGARTTSSSSNVSKL